MDGLLIRSLQGGNGALPRPSEAALALAPGSAAPGSLPDAANLQDTAAVMQHSVAPPPAAAHAALSGNGESQSQDTATAAAAAGGVNGGGRLPLDIEQGRSSSSDLDAAPRMQIVYEDLVFTVQEKVKGQKDRVAKTILKGVSGVIQPGRVTAVMGASGAGKTTFLNVLSGFAMVPHSSVGGSISVNGELISGNKMRLISGFVHQEDVILETMTVREALLFSALLRLPHDMPRAAKERRALDVAELLNLSRALNNEVGSSMQKGISGGEKRRLALGMEMITNPSILFLDEPTSGLDTYTAYKVMQILAAVAHLYSRTVVCTIHQPSSDIFHKFDDLIVLAEGQVIYHGASEDMVVYFSKLGYECPRYTNPADFLFMDILNRQAKGDEQQFDFLSGNARAPQLPAAHMTTVAPPEKAQQQEVQHVAGAFAFLRRKGKVLHNAAATDASHILQQAGDRLKAEMERVQALIGAWEASEHMLTIKRSLTDKSLMRHGIDESAVQHTATFAQQFALLFSRAGRNAWRNKLIIKGKLAQTVFLSLVIGLIYLRIGTGPASVQDRQGSLFFLVVQGIFGSVMGVLTIFGAEKVVFKREYGARLYGLPAYFWSRWLVELPTHIIMPFISCCITYWMIGYQAKAAKFFWYVLIFVLLDNCGAALGIFVSCLFNDIAVAMAVMPMFLLPLMVFSGFFVNSDNIPPYFTWIQYISPMRYGFIALIVNEFTSLTTTCNPSTSGCPPSGTEDGQTTIDALGFDNDGGVGENAGILFAIMWALLILAYVALWMAVRRLGK